MCISIYKIYNIIYIYIYYVLLSNDDTPWKFFSLGSGSEVELLDEEEAEQAKLSRLGAILILFMTLVV